MSKQHGWANDRFNGQSWRLKHLDELLDVLIRGSVGDQESHVLVFDLGHSGLDGVSHVAVLHWSHHTTITNQLKSNWERAQTRWADWYAFDKNRTGFFTKIRLA
jgi:hypothetical protein